VHPCSAPKHAANANFETVVAPECAIHASRRVSHHTCARTGIPRLTSAAPGRRPAAACRHGRSGAHAADCLRMHSGRAPRPHARTSYALDDADLLRFGCFELRPRERRLLVDGKEARRVGREKPIRPRAQRSALRGGGGMRDRRRDRPRSACAPAQGRRSADGRRGGHAGCRMLRGDEAPCRVVI